MGLDMYLTRMPRYGNTTPQQVHNIDNYFAWLAYKEQQKAEGRKGIKSLKEYCGIAKDQLPDKACIDFYRQHLFARPVPWNPASKTIMEDVGYWRKANHIHRWFVENVQNGVDDQRVYEVTKEQLEDLMCVCRTVAEKCTLHEGIVQNGYTVNIQTGQKNPCMEKGKQIINSEIAAELLPRGEGFFFGSYAYDKGYMEDIEHTISILERVLEQTDFKKSMIGYSCWW